MPKPKPPEFRVRFFPGLKEKLEGARGSQSLNKEINQRLERSFESDSLARFADKLRPFLARMSEAEQAELIEALAAIMRDSPKNPGKRQPRR